MPKKIKKKVEIITEEDRFLETAEIVKIEPLKYGTGYSANQVLKAIPDADPKEVFELLREKFHKGVWPESKAITQVIRELRQKKS